MTIEAIEKQLGTRGSKWFNKLGVTVWADGTATVYKSRKPVFSGTVAETAQYLQANAFPTAAQAERQQTRKGGQYAKYEIRCEFCNKALNSQNYDTVEREEDGQPYAVCPSCKKKFEAGKL